MKRPTAASYLTSSAPAPSTAASSCQPNPQMIQQSVNAAQRKSSINPPPVVAVPDWINATMGPLPISHHHAITGPDVVIPTSWQGLAAVPIPSRLTNAIGYSLHHKSHIQENVSDGLKLPMLILISAVHEAGGHKKSRDISIGNICEGKKDIDAYIDAPGLINLALEMVLPKLCALGSIFSWCDEEFIVQDSG
ncbi:uncharacterized protein BJ212DRAFT_1478873 [Suillus subaureus]|uniref:Uncharacterized protein n=1 Tax=Suillus subaureus TaxID=48587 RepID=A0A9P7EEK7_9AGAM|nr:uncharacterized protein BJ212DRAFT_1478873 [Suillus subaureus]KAG1819633.1 hypothetical protein BJ212DRAFT_1478873 [Suillus subaureus]